MKQRLTGVIWTIDGALTANESGQARIWPTQRRICYVSNSSKAAENSGLAGQPRITSSSFDPSTNRVLTQRMSWISLYLAGTSLLALPHLHRAAQGNAVSSSASSVAYSAQTASAEGNLPASTYLELRKQTLAHARPISGPRLKNPALASGGIDRVMAAALAEQRANRLSRVGVIAAPPGATTLLSGHPATLLNMGPSTPPSAQMTSPLSHGAASKNPGCTFPAIRTVNGRSVSPVFTPAEPDNHYRISGCAFGTRPGMVRLQPAANAPALGPPPQPITLELETLTSWTDDSIDVHINAALTGTPDFTADLVVQLSSGITLRMPRCQFLAVRGEPQLLRSIPASWVRLDAPLLSARAIRQVEFESPPVASEEVPLGAVGASTFIARSDPRDFATGKDTYDLSQLAPGWAIDSVQIRVLDAACPGENKLAVTNGSWETSWTPRGFVVAWARETCASPIPPVFNFTLSSSQYAMDVWVVGPAGTLPLPNNFTVARP